MHIRDDIYNQFFFVIVTETDMLQLCTKTDLSAGLNDDLVTTDNNLAVT